MKPFLLASAITFASLISTSWAAIQTKPVQFENGKSSAAVTGTLKGDQTIDFSLQAKAGQAMSVTFKPTNPRAYFNILPPGSTGDAIFIGSTSGNEWTGTLPTDGEYKVRTYLMRSAARRNETAKFTLTVGITGAPAAAHDMGKAPASDKKVAGTPYHATSKVPCSIGTATNLQCDVGVIRGRPGNAEVHVTPPGGLERVLRFTADSVTSAGTRIKATKQGDMWSIEINDAEYYQIPEAVIFGG